MNYIIKYSIRPYDTIWMLAQTFNTTVDSIINLNPGINPGNLLIGQVISINPGFQYSLSYSAGKSSNSSATYGVDDLRDILRLLWEQNVHWMRAAVTGIVHDLSETNQIVQRLLLIPTDFANALKPFYGEDAAQKFADLLNGHLKIAIELVQAAKKGNNDAVTEANLKWHENAEQIAAFLAIIIPEWSAAEWRDKINRYLKLLSNYFTNILAGNYESSMSDFNNLEMQALEIANVMAEGIGMQFPY